MLISVVQPALTMANIVVCGRYKHSPLLTHSSFRMKMRSAVNRTHDETDPASSRTHDDPLTMFLERRQNYAGPTLWLTPACLRSPKDLANIPIRVKRWLNVRSEAGIVTRGPSQANSHSSGVQGTCKRHMQIPLCLASDRSDQQASDGYEWLPTSSASQNGSLPCGAGGRESAQQYASHLSSQSKTVRRRRGMGRRASSSFPNHLSDLAITARMAHVEFR